MGWFSGLLIGSLKWFLMNPHSQQLLQPSMKDWTSSCCSLLTSDVEKTYHSSFWFVIICSSLISLRNQTSMTFLKLILLNWFQTLVSLWILSVIGNYFSFCNILFVGKDFLNLGILHFLSVILIPTLNLCKIGPCWLYMKACSA